MGTRALTETTVDSKGRIVIPEEIRKELGLGEGSKLDVSITGVDNIVIKSKLDPDSFVAFAEGFVKQGSPVKAEDPLRLKEIWVGR